MPKPSEAAADVAIIGAGPAGLTAAYLLTKAGISVIVIEKDPVYVGGISRTVEYNGFMFDIGGHRFFSKSSAVEDLWTEILPDDLLQRRDAARRQATDRASAPTLQHGAPPTRIRATQGSSSPCGASPRPSTSSTTRSPRAPSSSVTCWGSR